MLQNKIFDSNMSPISKSSSNSYDVLLTQLESLLDKEAYFITNASNFTSFVFHNLSKINWVGFYFLQHGSLHLGPFQGEPACTRISLGKGVCGTAAKQQQTIIVNDVNEFPGHIACSADSRSEVVIPLIFEGKLLGVFDVDSPVLNRFSKEDVQGLKSLVSGFLSIAGIPQLW
jgi:L-methionine (R)-S-oxide reductase